MNKKCPACNSPIVRKDGKYKTTQRYKCMSCGNRFRGGHKLTKEDVWDMCLHSKQTAAEISSKTGVSPSTVKRILSRITFDWKQPHMADKGVIHLYATYFGRNTGVLLALESLTGRLLYMKHIAHEHISDYEDAVNHIQSSGYEIKGNSD